MLLGHIAVPFILKHYLEAELAPLTAGTLFPDVFDKTLQQVGLVRSGRTLAHTLFAVTISTVIMKFKYGGITARDWMLGYLGHLICDLGGFVPWWYPFSTYDFVPSTRNIWQKLLNALGNISSLELLLLIWAARILIDDLAQSSPTEKRE